MEFLLYKEMIVLFLYFLVIIPFFTARTTTKLEAKFACKGQLSVYFIGNQSLFLNNSANLSSTFIVKPRSEVLAVRCRNGQSKPWLIGSFSNGLVTDTRWRCFSRLPKELYVRRQLWNKKADDSQWPLAFASYANREDSPWGKIPGIREDAFWISTVEEDHRKLFCRRRLSDLSLKWEEWSSKAIFQATIDDVDYSLRNHSRSQHQVSDVMECFKQCQAEPQCLSFNFEHDSVLPTRKCELNGVTKGQDPRNYVRRPGYTYYDSV